MRRRPRPAFPAASLPHPQEQEEREQLPVSPPPEPSAQLRGHDGTHGPRRARAHRV